MKRTLLRRSARDPVFSTPQGAFTPGPNDANDLHVKSMQRRERQSCGAIRANEAARMARIEFNYSEFHARMARISRANGASKLKMFKRPTSRE